jgi:hypothetical protein
MKSCTQAKIETYFVRFLASVVVGAVAYFAAEPIAQYFQYNLPDLARWIGTGVLALGGWFATKNLVDFTTDCLDVPSAVAPAVTSRKQAERPTSKQAERPTAKRLPQLAKAAPVPVAIVNVGDKPHVIKSAKITATVTKNDDASLAVTVVVTGASGSDFKGNGGIRSALESVQGIAWSNPTNAGGGTRRMEGKIAAGANHQAVIGKLTAVVERKGA